MVLSWEEFDAKAKELVASGKSHIVPADRPQALLIGYNFSIPNTLDGSTLVRIKAFDLKKNGIPEEIIQLMQTEHGKLKIAKNWSEQKEI